MAQPNFYMPMRNERAAPKFDSTNPRELPRFFQDLEHLFTRANVALDFDKKQYTVDYADYATEQVWKTFPEFKAVLKTYEDFRDAILEHYPDAAGDFIYSIRNMDMLIGERQRIGMNTSADLSDYHLQFMAITTWLIDQDQLGPLEQKRAYLRGFPPHLLAAVHT